MALRLNYQSEEQQQQLDIDPEIIDKETNDFYKEVQEQERKLLEFLINEREYDC